MSQRGKRLALLALSILTLAPACISSPREIADDTSDVALSDMSPVIVSLVERYDAPGLSVAVIRDGEIIFSEAYGSRDIETDAPVTTDTQFAIGSIVKSFTSGLVGTLQADGTIDIDASPIAYVPGLVFGDDELSADLKLHHLLTQTSGLPVMDGSAAFFPAATQADLAPRFAAFGKSCRVGDCWSYNNMNFILLDMVAESATRQSKSDLIKTRLLEPIGMTGTVSSTAEFLASANAAKPYGRSGGRTVPVAQEYLFGEHIYATADDMARWLAMWMNAGDVDGHQVIPTDYVTQAISMQAISDGAPPQASDPHVHLFGYGYGWMVKSMDGNYVVNHGGNENGFSAHVLFVPASGLGIVALTNQQGSILPNIVTDMLARRLLNLAETPADTYPVRVTEITPLRADASTLSGSPISITKAQEGAYAAPGYGVVRIRLTGETVSLETPLANFALVPLENSTFGLATDAPVSAGVNLEYFQVAFLDRESPALSLNIAPEPVIFQKID
ncbi:MAG: beta-lactamase family protein [Alphaproteobacteria bacterium]|nr:beta-lactamase family protein [Alphaproteobacteria bacterium]MBU2083608.1 beta-lactamase family protein [Alphaproteobacteria bacterium]MBU2143253.1 beta-lactamase family protein [Alphaproteobacteria bacterium]